MHDRDEAVFCSDLLGLICQNCDQDTLTRLSLTNRTISDEAIRVLWSSVENFGPLIRCMPADLWVERPAPSTPRTRLLWFRRPIRDTDYERFLLRAAHVRIFGSHSATIKYKVETDALLALCSAAGKNTKLLPQVRRLIFSDQALSCIGHYLSPIITQVDIYRYNESLLPILPTLALQCPLVTEAKLLGPGLDSVLTRTMSLVHQWSDLQSLVVTHRADVYGLSTLPALKNLEVMSVVHHPLVPIPKIPKRFPVLENLVIDDCDPEFCITLMRYMDQTPMKSISVMFTNRIYSDIWFGFFNAMKDGVVHDQIQSVDLDCAGGQSLKQSYSVETISPLLCYTNLSSIHLTSLHGFNFDDNAIDAMASSWKELRKFKVEIAWHPPASATYKSLVSFARHNPQLEELVILFDATTITKDILEVRPWKGICNQRLRMLDVRCSPIEAPDLVADFLTDIFPKLVRIGVFVDLDARAHASGRSSSQLHCERWKEVERLIRANMGQRPDLD
ncbi:hypothetical protein F5887DRAFT_165395 [Amanita rubescens]|nr:hypothetical protein F5887DRAFT_165395 [Amanita rubescens]